MRGESLSLNKTKRRQPTKNLSAPATAQQYITDLCQHQGNSARRYSNNYTPAHTHTLTDIHTQLKTMSKLKKHSESKQRKETRPETTAKIVNRAKSGNKNVKAKKQRENSEKTVGKQWESEAIKMKTNNGLPCCSEKIVNKV